MSSSLGSSRQRQTTRRSRLRDNIENTTISPQSSPLLGSAGQPQKDAIRGRKRIAGGASQPLSSSEDVLRSSKRLRPLASPTLSTATLSALPMSSTASGAIATPMSSSVSSVAITTVTATPPSDPTPHIPPGTGLGISSGLGPSTPMHPSSQLSDKSSYLNQQQQLFTESTLPLPTLKSSARRPSPRTRQRRHHDDTESEDADDEDDLASTGISASSTPATSLLSLGSSVKSKKTPISAASALTASRNPASPELRSIGPRLGTIESQSVLEGSPSRRFAIISNEADLFGSDASLSLADSSDDDADTVSLTSRPDPASPRAFRLNSGPPTTSSNSTEDASNATTPRHDFFTGGVDQDTPAMNTLPLPPALLSAKAVPKKNGPGRPRKDPTQLAPKSRVRSSRRTDKINLGDPSVSSNSTATNTTTAMTASEMDLLMQDPALSRLLVPQASAGRTTRQSSLSNLWGISSTSSQPPKLCRGTEPLGGESALSHVKASGVPESLMTRVLDNRFSPKMLFGALPLPLTSDPITIDEEEESLATVQIADRAEKKSESSANVDSSITDAEACVQLTTPLPSVISQDQGQEPPPAPERAHSESQPKSPAVIVLDDEGKADPLELVVKDCNTQTPFLLFAMPDLPKRRDITSLGRFASDCPLENSPLTHLGQGTEPAVMVTIDTQPTYPPSKSHQPNLYITAREILAGKVAKDSRDTSSVALLLKGSLMRALLNVQSKQTKTEELKLAPIGLDFASAQVEIPDTIEMSEWGATIGGGKGLFEAMSPAGKKQACLDRIEFRRQVVTKAFDLLNLTAPTPGWDRSAKVLTEDPKPLANDHRVAEMNDNNEEDELNSVAINLGPISGDCWSDSSETETMADRDPLSCHHCKQTFKTRGGLVYHSDRCEYAVQARPSGTSDGESTASETEYQREARHPARLSNDAASESEEDVNSAQDDGYVDDEEGIIMCVCGSKDEDGGMVQCDGCKVWLHLDCVDLDEDSLPDEYFCPPCCGEPVPSTGGKSFRHVPSHVSPKRQQRTALQQQHQIQQQLHARCAATNSKHQDDSSDDDDSVLNTRLDYRRIWRFQASSNCSSAQASDLDEDEDAQDVAEGDDQYDQESEDGVPERAVSPQVVLNHDWERSQSSSNLMTCMYGVNISETIFTKHNAPAMMLDGFSSWPMNELKTQALLSSQNVTGLMSVSPVPPTVGLDLVSEGHLSLAPASLGDASLLLTEEIDSFAVDYPLSQVYPNNLALMSDTSMDSEILGTPPHALNADSVEIWSSQELDAVFDLTPIKPRQQLSAVDSNCPQDFVFQLPLQHDSLLSDFTPMEDLDMYGLIDLNAGSMHVDD